METAKTSALQMNEAQLDKIRGSLLGGAAGDALGYPVEFMSDESIIAEYGNGGIQAYALEMDQNQALISDDTQMTLFTACGLLYGKTQSTLRGREEDLPEYVYRAYLDWLTTQGWNAPQHQSVSWILPRKELHALRAPGNTCLSALSSGKKGSTVSKINDSKGCGGVMRIAPCSLLQYPQKALSDRLAAEVAAITHGHPLGFIPAAFLNHVIHSAAFGQNDALPLLGIVEEAMLTTMRLFGEYSELDLFKDLVLRAVRYAENDQPDAVNIHALGGGWVAEEAVAIAIYCALKYQDDFTKALIASVNHSGDSDSTGAITGNILGAWLGYSKIDEQWKQNLELSDLILQLADDLCRGGRMHGGCLDEVWSRKYGNLPAGGVN